MKFSVAFIFLYFGSVLTGATLYVTSFAPVDEVILHTADQNSFSATLRLTPHMLTGPIAIPTETSLTAKRGEKHLTFHVHDNTTTVLVITRQGFSRISLPHLKKDYLYICNLTEQQIEARTGSQRSSILPYTSSSHQITTTTQLKLAKKQTNRYHLIFNYQFHPLPNACTLLFILPPSRPGSHRYNIVPRDYFFEENPLTNGTEATNY